MKMGVEQQGNQQVGDLLTWLREDERTRETVARLESTPYVKLPKSKARRGRSRSRTCASASAASP